MAAIGEGATEPDVAIHDAFDGVGDWFVEIVAFDKDGVEAGEWSCMVAAAKP